MSNYEFPEVSESRAGEFDGLWGVAEDGYTWNHDYRLMPGAKALGAEAFHFQLSATYTGPWLVPKSNGKNLYPVLKDRRVLYDFSQLAKAPAL